MEERDRRRILLTVAYDGTAYHGWQFQPGRATIEGELNRALCRLLKEKITVSGASRTDTGVHALGNLAVFDTYSNIPPEKMAYAINGCLPEDIRIRGSREVAANFHPRKCVSQKTYEYHILCDEFPDPLERGYAYFTYRSLDVGRMRRAAAYLIGEHDFAAFRAAGCSAKTTVRRIDELGIAQEGKKLVLRVTGSGFLYNMVRIIAGTLMEVGKGRMEPEDMLRLLEEGDRTKAGPTAPAHGLRLIGYTFPEDVREGIDAAPGCQTTGTLQAGAAGSVEIIE